MEKNSNTLTNYLVIPSLSLKAPLIKKVVDINGKMQNPDTPDDIVYHDFTNWPKLGGTIGKEGNAIFTGHVDSGYQYCDFGKTPPPCNAVLWDLDKVKKDETIEIFFAEKRYFYKVISNTQIKKTSTKWINYLKKSRKEKVTIISCSGNFVNEEHTYNCLQIVKAFRIKP